MRWCTRCRKSLTDYGDKLGADEKAKIEAALKDAEEALKSDDKAKIDAKAAGARTGGAEARREDVRRRSRQQQAPAGDAEAQGQRPRKPADDGNVVDAEFTEVKDRKG